MKLPLLLVAPFLLAGCIEGPPGPEGPRGADGVTVSAAAVANVLVRDHLDEIRGPSGEAGVNPTAEAVAAALVRDHLAEITGPAGQDGSSPTPAEVAQQLIAAHLPTIRGPAGAFDAVDYYGHVIGRVTGMRGFLWNDAAGGYFWTPITSADPPLHAFILTPPPGIRVMFSNSTCVVLAGETYVDLSSGMGQFWVDPMIIGAWASTFGVRGTLNAPLVDGVTIRSYNDGDTFNCQTTNEVRDQLIQFDTAISIGPWRAPMTLVPATQ